MPLIEIGQRFLTNDDVVYEIVERLLDKDNREKFRVANRSYTGERLMTESDIVNKFLDGEIRFHQSGKNTVEISPGIMGYPKPDFSMLPNDKQEEARDRFLAIKPLLALGKPNKKQVKERKDQLDKLNKKGSVASLYRWMKAYKESGGEIWSLVSNYENCGSIEKQFPQEVENTIKDVIESKWLCKTPDTIEGIYLIVRHGINIKNKERIKKNLSELPVPSLSTIRRRIKAIDLFEATRAQKGIVQAYNKYGEVNLKEKPLYPLQRVELDFTHLDLFVVDDEDRLPIGRPYFGLLIDCATAFPLGFYLGFEHPSYLSTMYALKHAIAPKDYVKELYPEVDNEWIAYGVPEVLVVDNGKEFKNKSLQNVCLELGINLVFAPPRSPWFKGQIERFFRTQNSELLHSQPGTSFSNIIARGDYDPKKNAVISLKTLLKIIHKFLLDDFVIDGHKGVGGKPMDLWIQGVQGMSKSFPFSRPDWDIILGQTVEGSIQRTGVQYKHLFYSSPEIHRLRQELLKNKGNSKIKFKIDPDDISKIHVYDEFNDSYIKALCTRQEYSKGLRMYTHLAIINKINEENFNVDYDKLAETKAIIQKWVEEEWQSNKTTKRKKAARHKEIGSNKIFDEKASNEEVVDKSKQKVATTETKAKVPTQKLENKKVIPFNPLLQDEDETFGSDVI